MMASISMNAAEPRQAVFPFSNSHLRPLLHDTCASRRSASARASSAGVNSSDFEAALFSKHRTQARHHRLPASNTTRGGPVAPVWSLAGNSISSPNRRKNTKHTKVIGNEIPSSNQNDASITNSAGATSLRAHWETSTSGADSSRRRTPRANTSHHIGYRARASARPGSLGLRSHVSAFAANRFARVPFVPQWIPLVLSFDNAAQQNMRANMARTKWMAKNSPLSNMAPRDAPSNRRLNNRRSTESWSGVLRTASAYIAQMIRTSFALA